jgi:hypothetical protein
VLVALSLRYVFAPHYCRGALRAQTTDTAATPIPLHVGAQFSSTLSCSAILRQREKKGNGTLAPPSATMIADKTHPWLTPFHEVLTNILMLRRSAWNVCEDLVKVREVRKRSTCYYSLRKAHASRRAQIKKRGGSTIAVPCNIKEQRPR